MLQHFILFRFVFEVEEESQETYSVD